MRESTGLSSPVIIRSPYRMDPDRGHPTFAFVGKLLIFFAIGLAIAVIASQAAIAIVRNSAVCVGG